MRAIQIEKTGPPEVLQLRKVNKPVAMPDEVVIQNELIGLNYVDTYYRNGSYKKELPMIPGVEGAGRVVALGDNVSHLAIGDRVVYAMQLGSYAEFIAVPSNFVYSLPEDIETEAAVVHFLQGTTAIFLSNMLKKTNCHPDSTILLRGAGSGVGIILLTLLKQKGINVIATTRSAEKAAMLMDSGAKKVFLDTGDADELCKSIQHYGDRLGATVIYDSVGGSETWKFLPCMRPCGLYVLFGQSAGAVPPLDLQALRQYGSLFVTRPSLTHYMSSFEETKFLGDELVGLVRSIGNLNKIDAVFSLEDAAKAHRHLEERKSVGKVLLRP